MVSYIPYKESPQIIEELRKINLELFEKTHNQPVEKSSQLEEFTFSSTIDTDNSYLGMPGLGN